MRIPPRDKLREFTPLSLMGNVNNPEVLLHGTPDLVFERTRYAMEAGVQAIGPECAIPLRTLLENFKAITRAVI